MKFLVVTSLWCPMFKTAIKTSTLDKSDFISTCNNFIDLFKQPVYTRVKFRNLISLKIAKVNLIKAAKLENNSKTLVIKYNTCL